MKKDHISRMFPGFSITLCFGKSGGFHFRWAEGVAGICLWYAALTFYMYDIEEATAALINIKDDEPGFSAN